MNQTPTIPICNLSIGSIAKIPSLPNMGELTILNSNQCGVRVKGSETSNDKTTSFDHTISCQTPVVLVGYNEEIAKENLAKQEKMRDMFGGGENVQSFLAEQEIDNKDNKDLEDNEVNKFLDILDQSNNNTDKNNQNMQNEQSANNQNTKTEKVENTENTDFSSLTNQYTRPSGNFTAREFSDLNKIQYSVALAYLKLNAKDMGKKPGGGRGRPTNLYSFDNKED